MRYKKFEGERLYFSPLDANDYQIFTKWINDETLARGVGQAGRIFDEMSEKSYIESVLSASNRYQFSIILKESDKLIGTVELDRVDFIHRFAEIGGFIGELEMRGKGYGTEASVMLCDYAFNVLNLNTIVGRIFSFNKGSIKSYEKVGFKKVGTISQRYFYCGKYYDEFIFEIHREDFYKLHKTFVKDV